MAQLFPRSQDSPDDGDDAGNKRDIEAAAIASETAGEYIVKLGQFVKNTLKEVRKRGIRQDDYKDGLVYQERKETLDGVFRTGGRSWMRKCTRCHA